ncbi:MAG: chemotaxis protein CheA, partial [Balneolales bacterium]|nr:chemotaxis protein CheA [Balneolales bacterium]
MDDVASFIMMADEGSFTPEQGKELTELLKGCIANETEQVSAPLKQALELVETANKGISEPGWFEIVSKKIEEATNVEENQEWEESQEVAEPLAEAESVKEEITEVANSETAVSESSEEEVPAKDVFYIPDDVELDMVGEFITECTELIEAAESALLDLEDSPDDIELVNTIFRAFHTIKGTSAFMGLQPITEFTHWVETVLSKVRDGNLPFDQACADINFESIDIIKNLLKVVEVSKGGDPLHTPEKFHKMMRVLVDVSDNDVKPADAMAKTFGENGITPTPVSNSETPSAETSSNNPTPRVELAKVMEESTTNTVTKTEDASVRVSVNRLDRLIDMVGELVIAHSVVAQDEGIPKDSELQKKVNHTTKILRELQDTSLTLRMVPLKATFHKMNRLVRDVSKKAGKNVKFTTFGEDTEIDRNMVDIINEPLIHMLRNSIDHGLETPDERAQTEKTEAGNITLSAFQEGGKVVIKISDDGRGINKDVIFGKAVEKGLIEPDKKLTDQEIYGLIFLPGFSSAEVVTDLSGRGVGMDVVRRSIEQLQGKVEVNSELGVGTTITIELPFTLAITDGMLVRVADQRFIVPTINIDMTFRAEADDLFTVLGDSEQVSFRGKSVPVIRLHRLFEISGAKEDILMGTLLVIKNNND